MRNLYRIGENSFWIIFLEIPNRKFKNNLINTAYEIQKKSSKIIVFLKFSFELPWTWPTLWFLYSLFFSQLEQLKEIPKSNLKFQKYKFHFIILCYRIIGILDKRDLELAVVPTDIAPSLSSISPPSSSVLPTDSQTYLAPDSIRSIGGNYVKLIVLKVLAH